MKQVIKPGLPLIVKKKSDPDFYRRGKSMSYLYVFQCQDLYKVGISRDPIARLKEIRAFVPFDVDPIGHIRMAGKNALRFEKSVHEELAAHRVRGEWFRTSVEEINRACFIVREKDRTGSRLVTTDVTAAFIDAA